MNVTIFVDANSSGVWADALKQHKSLHEFAVAVQASCGPTELAYLGDFCQIIGGWRRELLYQKPCYYSMSGSVETVRTLIYVFFRSTETARWRSAWKLVGRDVALGTGRGTALQGPCVALSSMGRASKAAPVLKCMRTVMRIRCFGCADCRAQ
jgi:hypothetical protein